MSVNTLFGTFWKFNDSVEIPENFSYKILFRNALATSVDSPVASYKAIATGEANGKPAILFQYASNGNYTNAYYWNTYSNKYTWYYNLDKIWILGGDDAENPDLIAWFEENAVQIDAIYKVWAEALTKTADAIRKKRGITDQLAWNYSRGFYQDITDIDLGAIANDCTACSLDIKSGVTAYSLKTKITGTMQNANGVNF